MLLLHVVLESPSTLKLKTIQLFAYSLFNSSNSLNGEDTRPSHTVYNSKASSTEKLKICRAGSRMDSAGATIRNPIDDEPREKFYTWGQLADVMSSVLIEDRPK